VLCQVELCPEEALGAEKLADERDSDDRGLALAFRGLNPIDLAVFTWSRWRIRLER
jgi:hypothetical protein